MTTFQKRPGLQFWLLLFPLLPAPLLAQLPYSDLHMVYPPFGVAGQEVEVTISGKPLEDVQALRFNDPKFSVHPVTTTANEIFPNPRPVKNRFLVTIASDAAPGIHEVRSHGYHGLSTARPFQVLPEGTVLKKKEGNPNSPETAIAITPGQSFHGPINARAIDWYVLSAKRGERFNIVTWAERLDSRMDTRLRIFDTSGRELDQNNDYFTRDSYIDFIAPEDGSYHIAVADNLYRGGSQYFYRLEVSRNPHIDFVWPPAGLPGTRRSFTIYGRNLPAGKPVPELEIDGKPLEARKVELDIPAQDEEPGTFSAEKPRRAILPGFEYRIANSNPARIGFATAPVAFEEEGKQPQIVASPVEVAGKFDHRGDVDLYRFTAEKDRTYHLEVYCDRLGISADPVLIVRKAGEENAKPIAENDDPESFFSADRFDATNLDTNDPVLSFQAPAEGDYEVVLVNNSSSGGPAHLYRLAIREATPDFQLLTTTEQNITATNGRAGFPGVPLLRKNGSIAFRVVALRRDEFDGPITVTAEGLPDGVTADPLTLHGKNPSGFLTVRAGGEVKDWTGAIRITGRAKIGEKEVTRTARNASLIWGVIFADSFRVRSRLDLETVLSVIDAESFPCRIDVAGEEPFTVELNQELEIPVKVADFDRIRKGNLTVQPHGFPGMLRSPPKVTIAEGKSEGTLKMNFRPNGNFKVTPGRYDFVLQGIGIAKHRTHVAAVAEAEKEVTRLEKLKEDIGKRIALNKEKAAKLQAAEEKDTEAIATLNKTIQKDSGLLQQIEPALTAARKEKSNAETTAKETDTKFAAFSSPITVEVTEPVKK